MSRLFPERVTVALDARDAHFGAQPWDGAVAALRARKWARPARVTVIVSNHFVRYALVPWNTALADPIEEEAYVRHHFVRVHGERAKSWALRWSEEPGDAPRLASAIDHGLLDALKKSFAGSKARLVSIQPALMAAANRARRSMPATGAWIVCAEGERACVALHAGARWRSVQNAKGAWLDTLEREWHRAEAGAPRFALLMGIQNREAPGWTFSEVPV